MESTGNSAGGAGAKARRLALNVSVAVFAARRGTLHVLLVRRRVQHGAVEWSLPGDFVGTEEPLHATAERALRDKTSLNLDITHMEQLHVYDSPVRVDGAGKRVVSVAYLAIRPDPPEKDEIDATGERWEPSDAILGGMTPVALGQADIVRDAVERLRHELEHTALATAFFRNAFTEAQLRTLYEAVWGAGAATERLGLDAPNFHRVLLTLLPTIIERVPGAQAATGGRPAALYRPSSYVRQGGPAARLERPIPRPRVATPRRRLH